MIIFTPGGVLKMEQNYTKYKNLVENMPAGYAYHKVIFDKNENPVDYVFLEVNKKFEKITGFERENIIGERISNITNDIEKSPFGKVEFYGEVSVKSKEERFEQYFKKFDRWYDIKAYSEKNGFFTTIYSDITERKKKEEKLNKKSKRLNTTLENINDIVWSMSWPDLNIEFISKSVKKIVGYTKKEFKNNPMLMQKITLSVDKKINKKFLKELRNQGSAEREFRIKCKDGSIKWVHDKSIMIYDSDNSPIRVEGVIRDITERKNREKELNLSKFSLDEAPMEIFWVDFQGEIKYANNTACERLKYKKDKLLNMKVSDIDPTFTEESRKKVWENLKRNEFQKFETKHLTKNGNKYPVEITSRYIKYNGDEYEFAFAQDITARKRFENTLKYSRERYETIFNSAPIGIIIEDKKGNIIEVNDVLCKMTGYTKDELEGNNVIDKLVLPEYRNKAKENIKKIAEGEDLEFDTKTIRKDGEIKDSHLKETNISLPNGNKGIISMYLDITERIKKRKQLEMLNFSINKANLLIFRVTPDGIIDYVNETALNKLGYDKEELIGFESKKIIKNVDYIDRKTYWQDIKNSGSIKYEIRFKPKEKNAFPVEVNSQYFKYDNQEYEFAFAQDITKRKEREREIEYLLYRDTLTGLYNRRFFNEEINRLDTKRQLPISIIMADVNGLKIINDSYGHKKGDELLVKTAKILKSSLRDEDIVARHGGDEFVILLPNTSRKKAQKIVQRIREKTEITKKNPIPISIGLGLATKRKKEEDIENIFKKADNVMYKNKLSKSKSAKNKIIQNLLNTLAAKSSETKQHALRMDKLAHELGKKINLSNSELNRLSLLATLHDIGKTTISKSILNKAGKLTENEWEIIEEHPETGYKIASASDEFTLVAEEILCHHEHWDGSGYPRGFQEENIPHLARIISIIDAYDVMTNNRPYSKAISNDEALAEIKKCAGSQFDPVLAQEFIELKKDN